MGKIRSETFSRSRMQDGGGRTAEPAPGAGGGREDCGAGLVWRRGGGGLRCRLRMQDGGGRTAAPAPDAGWGREDCGLGSGFESLKIFDFPQ